MQIANGDDLVLPEPKVLTWLGTRGTFLSEILSFGGTTAAGAAFAFEGATRGWVLAVGIVVAVTAIGFRAFRERHRKELTEHKQGEQRDTVQELLSEINMLDALILRASDPELGARDRKEQLSGARHIVLRVVSDRLGPDVGVSVNYFEVTSPERATLTAASWGRIGEMGRVSSRVFTPESPTLMLALTGRGRLVHDTRQLTGPEADEELEYRSFAVAPVFAVNSLFGLLTVDAKPVDGLTSFDQKLLMKYGSSLATTFVAQGGVPKINMDSFDRAGRIVSDLRHGGEPQ